MIHYGVLRLLIGLALLFVIEGGGQIDAVRRHIDGGRRAQHGAGVGLRLGRKIGGGEHGEVLVRRILRQEDALGRQRRFDPVGIDAGDDGDGILDGAVIPQTLLGDQIDRALGHAGIHVIAVLPQFAAEHGPFGIADVDETEHGAGAAAVFTPVVFLADHGGRAVPEIHFLGVAVDVAAIPGQQRGAAEQGAFGSGGAIDAQLVVIKGVNVFSVGLDQIGFVHPLYLNVGGGIGSGAVVTVNGFALVDHRHVGSGGSGGGRCGSLCGGFKIDPVAGAPLLAGGKDGSQDLLIGNGGMHGAGAQVARLGIDAGDQAAAGQQQKHGAKHQRRQRKDRFFEHKDNSFPLIWRFRRKNSEKVPNLTAICDRI